MSGGSRAAQRRQKKKQNANGVNKDAHVAAAGSGISKTQQQQQTKKKNGPARQYVSDGDSDSDSGAPGNLAAIPLPSLERSKVRDFVAEAKAATKLTKRARQELEQTEHATKKRQTRQEKTDKIVWRKFDRENVQFQQYYQDLLHLSDSEWRAFVAVLKEPVAVHVRVNGTVTTSF